MTDKVRYSEIRGPVSFKLYVTSLSADLAIELRSQLKAVRGVSDVHRDFASNREYDIVTVTMKHGWEPDTYSAWLEGGRIIANFQDTLPA